MNTLIRLLEKLVFLVAGVVLIFLAQFSKSYAMPIEVSDADVQKALPVAAIFVER